MHTSIIFGFGVLLLATLNLSCSSAEREYVGCTTNYSVLEQAVLEIGDNRYNILKAFYPVGSNLPSVYVNVTWVLFNALNDTDVRCISIHVATWPIMVHAWWPGFGAKLWLIILCMLTFLMNRLMNLLIIFTNLVCATLLVWPFLSLCISLLRGTACLQS